MRSAAAKKRLASQSVPGMGSLWDDLSDAASSTWDAVSHPADTLSAVGQFGTNLANDPVGTVSKAVTDEAQSLAKAAAPLIAGGLGGIAGGILGGIAGVFVMNPALGAKLGFDLGVMIGTGVETVDPKDVDGALSSGTLSIVDAAGNLLAGSPDAGASAGFVPVPPERVNAMHFIAIGINDKIAINRAAGINVYNVQSSGDVGAKLQNLAAYQALLNPTAPAPLANDAAGLSLAVAQDQARKKKLALGIAILIALALAYVIYKRRSRR